MNYTLANNVKKLFRINLKTMLQVNVGSAGMLLHRLNMNYSEEHQRKFDGLMVYAQCKRQLVKKTRNMNLIMTIICHDLEFCVCTGNFDRNVGKKSS